MVEPVQTIAFTHGRLPHWLVAGHAYFVTLCRKGCLPEKVVSELRAERADRAADLRASGMSGRTVARDVSDRAASLDAQRRRFLTLEAILDAAARSERDLCAPEVSRTVLANLDWLRGRGWRVWAVTLMPSHAHLVLSNTAGRGGELNGDLTRFRAYTARRINKARGASGGFWQREAFDHWCRDGDAWLRSVSYTLNNPVKAGLCCAWREWPYTVVDPDAEGLLT